MICRPWGCGTSATACRLTCLRLLPCTQSSLRATVFPSTSAVPCVSLARVMPHQVNACVDVIKGATESWLPPAPVKIDGIVQLHVDQGRWHRRNWLSDVLGHRRQAIGLLLTDSSTGVCALALLQVRTVAEGSTIVMKASLQPGNWPG